MVYTVSARNLAIVGCSNVEHARDWGGLSGPQRSVGHGAIASDETTTMDLNRANVCVSPNECLALLEFASTLPLRVSNCTKSLAFRRKVSRRCVDLERLDTVNNMRMSTPRQRVITYIAFVVAFALAADYAAPKAGSNASAFVVMWTPALAALAAGVLTRRSLGAIGWRLWPAKWLLAGWIIPILYAFPAYALVWLVGLGSVPSPTFLERARFTLGMPSEANWLVIVSAFAYIALVNLPPNMILTLGEEIGWRGFLVPELTTWSASGGRACTAA